MPQTGVAAEPGAGRRWPALATTVALAAVVAVLLWRSLAGGAVLTQADALAVFEPWKSAAPPGHVPGNELLLDQALGFLPWNDFAAERLRAGELPLWCPYNYGGIPLVGTCQSAIYWPLGWLYFAWPDWGTYAWIAAVKLLLAGAFAAAFLRRLGIGALAAAAGGLGYMLCGFMVAWLNHPHTNVALVLPALLWAVERAAARPGAAGSAPFGLLVGLQLLGGHVQTSVHVALLVGAWVAFRAVLPRGRPRLGAAGLCWLLVAALLGALLAMPHLLPFVEYLGHSQAATEFARDDLVAGDGALEAARLLVLPDALGAPHTHDYRGPVGDNLNYNELIGGYVGRTLLVLAVAALGWLGWGRRTRAVTAFFAAAAALSALTAWQVEPFYSALRSVPVLDRTKLMRLGLFVALGLCVLGAIGLDGLLRRWPRRAPALGAAVFALVAFELLAFARGYNPEVDRALLLPHTALTDFLTRQDPGYRTLALDNSVLRPNANTFYRIPMISGYDSMEDRHFTELVLQMTSREPDFAFVSRVAAFDRIEALPLASLLGARWLVSPSSLPPPLVEVARTEQIVYENPAAMPKVFVARDVTVIADPAERLAHMGSAAFDPHVAIAHAESDALRRWRERGPGGEPRVELREYAPRAIAAEVEVDRPSLVVVNDTFAPGWHAAATAADGTARDLPIERVDHALRGIWLDPGRWTLRLTYAPRSTTLGFALALAGVCGLLWLGLAARRSEPRGAAPEPAA